MVKGGFDSRPRHSKQDHTKGLDTMAKKEWHGSNTRVLCDVSYTYSEIGVFTNYYNVVRVRMTLDRDGRDVSEVMTAKRARALALSLLRAADLVDNRNEEMGL